MAKKKEFDLRFGVSPEIPAVHDQFKVIEINRKSIFPFGYNCSVCKFGSRTFLAYRWHEGKTWHTSLAIAELDDKFNVKENKRIELEGPANDDPRLFEHSGSLYVSWVNAKSMTSTTIRYAKLIESKNWQVENVCQVAYGRNDGTSTEKNWVPFSYGKKIHFIYRCGIDHTVIEVDNSVVINEYKSTGAKWMYGEIRGGTVPIRSRDSWFRFYHSRLNNEGYQYPQRYYVGAMEISSSPPFNVIRNTKTPIVAGSQYDSISNEERGKVRFWNPNTVFPLGSLRVDGGWLLSAGINHGICSIISIKDEDIKW